jgi:hypothetical protein
VDVALDQQLEQLRGARLERGGVRLAFHAATLAREARGVKAISALELCAVSIGFIYTFKNRSGRTS